MAVGDVTLMSGGGLEAVGSRGRGSGMMNDVSDTMPVERRLSVLRDRYEGGGGRESSSSLE